MSISPCIFIIKPTFVRRAVLDIFHDMFLDGCGGYKVKRLRLTRHKAELHYAEHKDKEHFNDLIDYMISDDVLIFMIPTESILENREKTLIFRGLFNTSTRRNVLHCSDSVEAAEREYLLFFGEETCSEN